MPFYDYQCPICDYTEEFMEKFEDIAIHLCTQCLIECNNLVRFDEDGKASERPSDSGLPGKSVRMERMLSAPRAIHQSGYKSSDARFRRGKGK